MQRYIFPKEDFDLELTMTCGQTFCWHRVNGELYSEGEPEFYTFREGEPLIVKEREDKIIAETDLPREEVEEALGLHHDLEEIFETFPEDELLDEAREELWGLRIVTDEFFPCLISYLCSPQMRIPRIKQMHNDIARKFGQKKEFNGITAYRFPTPEELSEATEKELRDLGVGYRAKYIHETTKMIVESDFDPETIREKDYEEAREHLKQFHGVGDKVADCVLLFSLGFKEAYPLDTWAKKSLKKHYSHIYSDDYEETSRKMRDYFGDYSGYAQEYIFHAARNGHIEV